MPSELLLLFSLAVSVLAGPRFQPIVTIEDAHGLVMGKQVFLWMTKLSEIKDRVQIKHRAPKDTMVLWYIPVDRDGYATKTVYNLDDSQTFAEVDEQYNEGRRGNFGVTMYR